MDFQELIAARRSMRSYEAAPSHDELVQILREAQQAPSWKNQQTARCYVAERADALRKAALPGFNQTSSANAALIVTTYVRDVVGFANGAPANEVGNGWGAYDLGLHDAYLILAAKNAGYDTLIMGLRDADVLRKELGIPDEEEVMSVIAIGKGKGQPAMRPRKALDDVVKFI